MHMSSRWLLPPLWREVLDFIPGYARPAYAEALPEFAAAHVPGVGVGMFRGISVDIGPCAICDDEVPVLDWAIKRGYATLHRIGVLSGDRWGPEAIKYVLGYAEPLSQQMIRGIVSRGDIQELQRLVRYKNIRVDRLRPPNLDCAKFCFINDFGAPECLPDECATDLPLLRYLFENYKIDVFDVESVLSAASPEVLEWVKKNVDLSSSFYRMRWLEKSHVSDSYLADFKKRVDEAEPAGPCGTCDDYIQSLDLALTALAHGDLRALTVLKQKNRIPKPPAQLVCAKIYEPRREYYVSIVIESFLGALRDGKHELLKWLVDNGFAETAVLMGAALRTKDLRILRWCESQGLLGLFRKRIDWCQIEADHDAEPTAEMVEWLLEHDIVPPPDAYSVLRTRDGGPRMIAQFDRLRAHGCPILPEYFTGGGRAALDWLERARESNSCEFHPADIMALALEYNSVPWFTWAVEKKVALPCWERMADRGAWDVIECALRMYPPEQRSGLARKILDSCLTGRSHFKNVMRALADQSG